MRRKMGWYMSALLFLTGMAFLFTVQAGAAAGHDVTVTPDQANANVSVVISDVPAFSGKEVSVICYAPGITGIVSDVTANKDKIVYMNQYTVKGQTSFQFKVKGQLLKGEYTLVVTSPTDQAVEKFSMTAEAPNAATAPAASTPPASTKKAKKLSAPEGVKAKALGKKKVKVTWKKVKGAKGYQVSTAKKKKGKYKVELTVKGASKKTATLKKMKKGNVYIKVRAYKLSGKKKAVGTYSKAVKVKVR